MPGFFTGIGHPAPEHCNPADHVMRLFVDPSDPEGSEERRKSIVEVATFLRELAEKLRKGQDEQYEKTQKGCLGSMPSWVLRPLLGTFVTA